MLKKGGKLFNKEILAYQNETEGAPYEFREQKR